MLLGTKVVRISLKYSFFIVKNALEMRLCYIFVINYVPD